MNISVSPKRIKASTLLTIVGILLFFIFVVPFFHSYFNESVFYFEQHKYKQAHEQDHVTEYRSLSGPTIEVQTEGSNRRVIIENEEYFIDKLGDQFNIKYEVTYPNGQLFEVNDHGGLLMSYDENGDWFVQITAFDSNGQKILPKGEVELLHPSGLVTVAYSEYHEKQGEPILFVFSILLFIYGWCGYRYEKFQNFLFKISMYWVWVREAEPSDFYYFMCKVGGIVVMIMSVVVFFTSL
ncbi:hypothetical protein YSY43_22020 [Paenibacillus sp. YSY-4.3]